MLIPFRLKKLKCAEFFKKTTFFLPKQPSVPAVTECAENADTMVLCGALHLIRTSSC